MHIIYCSLQQNMNVLLTQIPQGVAWPTILAARNSEGEDTIWMQMMVIVILAAFIGIFSLVKARANKFKGNDQRFFEHRGYRQNHSGQLVAHNELLSATQTAVSNINEKKKFVGKAFNLSSGLSSVAKAKEEARAELEDLPSKREKDLQSGMELLGSEFLLKIVENTNDGNDEKDVVMRKLNFKELLRRGELNQADSNALKEYAVNKGNLYGKDIQCEAIKILAERTAKGKKSEN